MPSDAQIAGPDNRLSRVLRRLVLGDAARPAAGAIPGGTEMGRYLLAALVAAVPSLALAAHWFGPRVWTVWTATFLCGAAVEVAFGLVRRRAIGGGILVYSAVFTLLVPPTLPLWMPCVAMAFGTTFGKEVFGGTGSHLFSPALVAKGFLFFSYPSLMTAPSFGHLANLTVTRNVCGSAEAVAVPDAWILGAGMTLIAMVTMTVARPSNLRIIAAIGLAAAATATGLLQAEKLPYDSLVLLLASDGFLVTTCFLTCDPACSPRNDEAKWLYGMLIGAVAVLMRSFSNYDEAILCAALLGSVFAPTFDLLAERKAERRAAA